jgi:predicted regulator of amino acid metabolism with ACT domain
MAVVSAVFSYFLYEKRASLVTGHGYFAKHLAEATQKLEKNSGKKQLSDSLNESGLSHGKGAKNINSMLVEFNKLVTAVVDERDVLAATLAQISNTVELSNKKENFSNLVTYKKASEKLSKHVLEYRKRNDVLITNIVSSGRNLGTRKLSVPALKSNQYAAAFRELDDRISFWRTRNSNYENSVAQIASALKASRPDRSEGKYSAGLNTLVTHARKVEAQRMEYYRNWQNEKRKVNDRDATIDSLKKEIEGKEADIKARDLDIKRLERMLGVSPERRAIEDGCEAALQLVKTQQKGKIMEVNKQFSFVVISLGKNTKVQDYYDYKPTPESKLEVRKWDVNPVIEQGMILTVARDMASGDAEYINKIKIVKLHDHCAIAESVDKRTGKPMLEGDIVYLADDEIAKWVKNRK